MLLVQGEPQVADVWCRDWRVVDGKGLPLRCLRASRHTKGADAEGLFHCTLHLRAFFALLQYASRRPGGERSGPGRRILFFVH